MRSSFGIWSGMLLLAALAVVTVHSVYVSQTTGYLVEELVPDQTVNLTELEIDLLKGNTLMPIDDMPSVCRVLSAFPQTPEEVEREFGVSQERVQMIAHYKCDDDSGKVVYWGFEILEGPEIEVKVPFGGMILVHDGLEKGQNGSGTAVGTSMRVTAKSPIPALYH